ncbi:TetR/AcrR family transcriptional regulator [Microbacterium sp. EST19A]|uniref:TetR/AcrR family transcriptional regulator n=1 Tax=Microbacterium sp. EST19A TaxID=2862681 RepID=UPI001CBF3371|nr:TetR/AcrR family transcriptional regulator [Microbacterium sp. EST19A]
MATRKAAGQAKAPARQTGTPARPRRARDSLSRDIIVAAADRVVEREGLDRLTFQAIGEELGAHPTSIYRHFRDKEELLLALIDSLRHRSYSGGMVATDDWLADLRSQAHLIHDHYMRYPEFALQMALRRPTDFGSMEYSIGALRRGGYDREQAALYARALGQLIRSASSIQAALSALPSEVQDADELTWQMDQRRLDPAEYPEIAWVGEALPGIRDPRAWETALDLLLESIERHAPGA